MPSRDGQRALRPVIRASKVPRRYGLAIIPHQQAPHFKRVPILFFSVVFAGSTVLLGKVLFSIPVCDMQRQPADGCGTLAD